MTRQWRKSKGVSPTSPHSRDVIFRFPGPRLRLEMVSGPSFKFSTYIWGIVSRAVCLVKNAQSYPKRGRRKGEVDRPYHSVGEGIPRVLHGRPNTWTNTDVYGGVPVKGGEGLVTS